MKGITHFLTGVATATFFPAAIQASVHEKSWIILLGGAMGIMADTLDFRASRYLYKHDYEVIIDEKNLDPQIVAKTVAKAINEAHKKQKTVTVKLNTIKVSANYYRTYNIRFDNEKKEVVAAIGPLKSLGQTMGGGGHKPLSVPEGIIEARAPYKAELTNIYAQKTEVAIFSGPDFAFVPEEGKIRADFIPWHRTWAHSLTLGFLLGIISLLLFVNWSALWENGKNFISPLSYTAFWIGMLAFVSHVANDQIGVLGSQLFYPWGKKRMNGLGLTSSADPVNNIICNYFSLSLIIFNLNAFSGNPLFYMPWAKGMEGDFFNLAYYLISLANFCCYYILVPAILFSYIVKLYKRFSFSHHTDTREESAEGEDTAGEMGTI